MPGSTWGLCPDWGISFTCVMRMNIVDEEAEVAVSKALDQALLELLGRLLAACRRLLAGREQIGEDVK